MTSESTRICIYFSDTGGGHRSAAEAVKAGIQMIAQDGNYENTKISVITQPIIETSHPILAAGVALYGYMARHHSTWIKYFYQWVHFMKPESLPYSGLYRTYSQELLRQQKPSVIVITHPLLTGPMTRARNKVLDPSVKVAVLVTDPNERLWKAWACHDADVIIAANNVVRDKLISWGIDPDKVQVLGMPVHPAFLTKADVSRTELLTSLGLSPNKFTVCINTGWAGNAHLLHCYEELAKCKQELQVIFLCGYNKKLFQQAEEKAKRMDIPTVVLSFHNQMPDLMAAVDLMLTKAGGLTTFEALARRLPLVLDNTIEPMPQEEQTVKMLTECRMATRLDNPADLPGIVDAMKFHSKNNPNLPAAYELNLTDKAVFRIAEAILCLRVPQSLSKPTKTATEQTAPLSEQASSVA